MTDLLLKFLKKASVVSVEKQDLHLQLLSHPDYPSLKAITDSLDYFGIENVAANVPKDALVQLPPSFLALIEIESITQLVLVYRESSNIRVTLESGKIRRYGVDEFLKLWTGTIIAIEVPEKKVSKSSLNVSRKNVTAFVLILSFLGMFVFQGVTAVTSIYAFLSLLGLIISYLIIDEALGKENVFVARVCGTISSSDAGCSRVINSKSGVVLKGLTLGDISFIYFLSLTISTVLFMANIGMLLFITALSLPVIFYTIYSQAFVLKSWCALCLGTSAVVLLQFVTLVIAFSGWDFSLQYLANGIFIVTLVSTGWLLTKPLLKSKKLLKEVQKDYMVLKRDASVFGAILKENEVINLEAVGEDSQIFFGNRNGVLQLTAYTNPLCGYCTEAFKAYDKLLKQFPEDVGVQFVFNTPKDIKNQSTLISKRIVELYIENANSALSALRLWFSSRDLDLWKASYGERTSMLLTSENILSEHRKVVTTNRIDYTPETLIGNSKLSRKHYQYRDLPLFINYLKEQKEEAVLQTVAS